MLTFKIDCIFSFEKKIFLIISEEAKHLKKTSLARQKKGRANSITAISLGKLLYKPRIIMSFSSAIITCTINKKDL